MCTPEEMTNSRLGAPTPFSSLSRLPKVMQHVGHGQSVAMYQLYKASDGAADRANTQRVYHQTTGWAAPSYMDRSTNPAKEPFSLLGSRPDSGWSTEDPMERLEPHYGDFDRRTQRQTPWNEWQSWNMY